MASQLPRPALQLQGWMQSGPQCALSQAARELRVILGELHIQVRTQNILGQEQGRDQWTKDRQRTHIPLWQLRPVHPGAQLQRPVAGWQCPSLAQAHLIWQPVPNQPAGQAVGGKEAKHGSLVCPPRAAGRGQTPAILTILAAAANKAREAQAGSSLRVAAGTMFTCRADLLTAKPPTALGTI